MFFEPVTEDHLNAYEPYLLSVIPSSVSFYAEDVTIPSTRPAVTKGNNFDFVGSTVAVILSTNMFRWSCDHNYFYWSDTDTGVFYRPFSALMYLKKDIEWDSSTYKQEYAGMHLMVINKGESATGIQDIQNKSCDQPGAIYSLSGQRLKSVPAHGIYIIDGKKYIAR
jgi:hypothetical protein